MASKLDSYRDQILERSEPDKIIARDAGVTLGAVRAARARWDKDSTKVIQIKSFMDHLDKENPIPDKKEKKKANKKKTEPKSSSRRSRTKPPEGVDKLCPRCDAQATGEEEVGEIFGWRNTKKKDGTSVRRPQTWCRGCRKAAAKARRAT